MLSAERKYPELTISKTETNMKEYKYLRTFADSSFEPDVNGLVRQGWKVIHIEWLIPDVAVFFERDIPDKEDE